MFDFLFNGIAFIVTLGILVTFHEWGHYYAARKLGVKVLRFSVGFGKPLWRRVANNGVEFVVAGIPLGGYVKMLDERERSVSPEEQHLAFNRQPVWKRNIILFAGPLANFVLALLLYWAMFLIGVTSPKSVIGPIDESSLLAQSGFKAGDEIVAVDGEPVSTLQDTLWALAGRLNDGRDIELTVIEAGQRGELLKILNTQAWQVDDRRPDILGSLGYKSPIGQAAIGKVTSGGPADLAGLRAGDLIVSVNEQPIDSFAELGRYMQQTYQSGPISVAWRRGDLLQQAELTPRKEGERYRLGVESEDWFGKYVTVRQFGLLEGLQQAVTQTFKAMGLTVTMLKKLVSGEVSTKSLGGPLSIAEGAGSSASFGLVYFLSFLGMISVNLGLINLLPVPMLDGGQLLFNFIEYLKGEPISESSQEIGTRIGLVLVLGMMMIAIVNDFARLM